MKKRYSKPGGESYPKYSETNITSGCLEYLQILENAKDILWVDRLNSGNFFTGKYKVRGCRPGTPDIYFISKIGEIVWIETKYTTDLSVLQKLFRDMVRSVGHTYWVIRSVRELQEKIGEYLEKEG